MKILLTLTTVVALACPVLAALPTAEFVATPIAGTAPLEVTFTDYSTGTPAVTNWEWDFGDGGTAVGQAPPAHTYTDPGTYTVTLTVTNADGSDTQTKQNYIVVGVTPDYWAGENTIGVYFNATYPNDVELDNDFDYTASVPFNMYWVLSDCTQASIGGFEFSWRFENPALNATTYFVLGVALPTGALNIGNNQNLIVGIGDGYPTQPQKHSVLASMTLMILVPVVSNIQIGPAVPASIPGHVVFNDGSDPSLLFPAAYSTVDLAHAVINEDGFVVTPLGSVGGDGPVATESKTFSDVKALFR